MCLGGAASARARAFLMRAAGCGLVAGGRGGGGTSQHLAMASRGKSAPFRHDLASRCWSCCAICRAISAGRRRTPATHGGGAMAARGGTKGSQSGWLPGPRNGTERASSASGPPAVHRRINGATHRVQSFCQDLGWLLLESSPPGSWELPI
jgi:hypothetical protein